MNKNYNAQKACGGEKQKSIKISEYFIYHHFITFLSRFPEIFSFVLITTSCRTSFSCSWFLRYESS